MDLNGKNVVYIGGFGGIGQQCLREFLERAVQNLIIFDLNENAAVMKELQQAFPGIGISFIKLDITSKANIEQAYKEAVDRVGHIDVVVNGCGLMNDRHVELTIQINLLGVINSTLEAMKYMDKSAGGRGGIILNISSVAGLEPAAIFAVYSAAKFGVTAFTRAMGNPFYYAHTGIGFVTVCPGFTETALLDMPLDKITFDFAAPISERFMKVKRQTAAECAKNLVKAVELAKNGSVWLLDLTEMKEVEMPLLWKPTLNE